MERCIFAFPSVTAAMKAQSVLRKAGIGCEVIRTPKNLSSGCGYSTVASCRIAEAADVFGKNGITFKAAGKY